MTHHDEGLAQFPNSEECLKAILLWKQEVMRLNPQGLNDLDKPHIEKNDFVFPY